MYIDMILHDVIHVSYSLYEARALVKLGCHVFVPLCNQVQILDALKTFNGMKFTSTPCIICYHMQSLPNM